MNTLQIVGQFIFLANRDVPCFSYVCVWMLENGGRSESCMKCSLLFSSAAV